MNTPDVTDALALEAWWRGRSLRAEGEIRELRAQIVEIAAQLSALANEHERLLRALSDASPVVVARLGQQRDPVWMRD